MDCLKLSSLYSLRSGSSLFPPPAWASSGRRVHAFSVVVSLGAQKKAAAVNAPGEPSPSEPSSQGPTEKSRGELFLEKALSKRISNSSTSSSSSKLLEKKKKKKKKKEGVPLSKLNSEPGCYGCGAILQTQDEEAPGYVPLDTYETKKKHHQLRTVLCGRCRSLTHGQMIPAVGGHGGYGGKKVFISAEQLRVELSHLCNEKALVINLVDIADFNGSFLTRIRDLVGANPIVLVATKIDLLPRGTNLTAVGDWILEFITRKKLNVISVHLTSAKSLEGISSVVSYIRQQRQGRNVYILGSANVGKSAFVSAILQELSKRDLAASAALRHLPIQSAMPGTTLGPIEIKAFSGGGSLFDTPGIHVHHRMAAVVLPKDLTLLAPRRRLRGYLVAPLVFERAAKTLSFHGIESATGLSFKLGDDEASDDDHVSDRENESFPMPLNAAGGATEDDKSLSRMSVFWGGIVRLDIVKAPPYVGFRFYGPNAVPKETVATSEADLFYKEQLGRKLTPPTNAEDWPGLQSQHTLNLTFESWDRPVCDIAISGLGWVTIESGYADYMEELEGKTMDNMDKVVQVILHVPKSVEVFVRPSLPVGFRGSEWYDYRELTEKELEARPKVYLP